MLRRTLLAGAFLPAASSAAEKKFARVFFHDKDKVESSFSDFAMLSPELGLALGTQMKIGEGRPQGFMLRSADGGKNWIESPLKFLPLMMCHKDGLIWALSSDQQVWFSAETGRDWTKLSRVKNILRLHFVNDRLGFAVGIRKTVLRTLDGGKKWEPVPEAAKVSGSAESAGFTWVNSVGDKLVSIFGNSQLVRRRRRQYVPPDWMDPEKAKLDVEKPSITISLDSADGGKTFTPNTVSAFGTVSRVRLGPDRQGLVMLRFERFFPFGGELYKFRNGDDKGLERILRPEDQVLQDVIWVPNDGVYVAVTERSNRVTLPVAAPVKILHSTDLSVFREVAVDYRAEGRSVFLSEAGGTVWAATDEGMILRLS